MSNTSTIDFIKSLRQAYTKKDYDSAIDILLKNKDKMENGLFHYNLGTIYLKKNNLGAGRYNLEKAIKAGFQKPDAFKNLDYVESVLPVEKMDFYHNVMFYSSSINFGTISFVSLLLLVIILLINFKLKLNKYILIGVLVLLSLFPLGYKKLVSDNIFQAIVLETTQVREGPSKIFEISSEVPSGTKLIIENINEGWAKIIRPQRYVGHIKIKEIGIL